MGHVLAIMRTGATIPDPQSTMSRDYAPQIRLPDERYGLAFVFRVFGGCVVCSDHGQLAARCAGRYRTDALTVTS